jgi:LytS/YehU family sensor histidine kinase
VNQLPLGIFVYFVMLISIRAIASARRLQQAEVRAARLAAQLSKAQLQALKMQLHPHFLFNTLNSISTLIHENADAADEMIGRLGDFLRLTLDNLGTQIVTLQRELEFLTLYLSIEEIRFQDRLTVHFEIDQDTTLLRVPNLIFQPLVENAIKHGIAPEAKKGTITIRSSSKDGRLRLEVEDNGPGVRPDRVNNQGLGLKNIKERLDELYGRDYRLELKNHPNGGCTTLLDIPAQPNNMGQQLTVRS